MRTVTIEGENEEKSGGDADDKDMVLEGFVFFLNNDKIWRRC